MEDKQRFAEGLERMRELAGANGSRISVQGILGCFPDMELTREMIGMVYRYAEQQQIEIEDYQPHDTRTVSVGDKNPELTGEEKATFRMYLEELELVEPCEADEAEMLVERLMNGEDEVIGRLTEGHLHLVLEIARKRAGHGILIGDLVQEGNIALMMALQDLSYGESLLAGGLSTYLKERVDQALQAILAEQQGYEKAGSHMARETNRLLRATLELEEELGREATLAELAAKMELSEEKVRELVQVSLNAAEFSQADTDNEE